MHNTTKNQVYTPQISFESAFTLRRLAWAVGKPMTKTLNGLISILTNQIKLEDICNACKDKRCDSCPIKNQSEENLDNINKILRK